MDGLRGNGLGYRIVKSGLGKEGTYRSQGGQGGDDGNVTHPESQGLF
jgi:hypothetical protein